jgi:hypothetical protein
MKFTRGRGDPGARGGMSSPNRSRVALATLLVTTSCYARLTPSTRCETDDQCANGLECIAGTCQPAEPTVEPDARDVATPDAATITTPDAAPDAFVDTSLIAHWKFDDSPTDGALDSSARGHTATCAPACPTVVAGKHGMAYQFDAAMTQALVVADSTEFRGMFTLAAWMRATTFASQMAIMSKPYSTSSANSWQLEALTTAKLSFSGGTTHYLESPAATTTNQWFHVAGTWDGVTKRLYINGALVSSVDSAISYDTHPLFLGADENSGSTVLYWTGALDDIRIYNRVLTAQEILALTQ